MELSKEKKIFFSTILHWFVVVVSSGNFRMVKTDLAVKCAVFDFRLALCAIFRPLAWGFSGIKRSESCVVWLQKSGGACKSGFGDRKFLVALKRQHSPPYDRGS